MARFKFFLLLGVVLFSCTTSRQLKEDNKTFVAAISNPRVYDRLDHYILSQHSFPAPTVIKGKDSIIEVTYLKTDTLRDSIIRIQYPKLNLDSLRQTLTRTITKIRVDTVKGTDSLCQSTLQTLLYNISNLEGKNKAQELEIIGLKKSSNKWLWSFILTGIALLGTIGFWFITTIKK